MKLEETKQVRKRRSVKRHIEEETKEDERTRRENEKEKKSTRG